MPALAGLFTKSWVVFALVLATTPAFAATYEVVGMVGCDPAVGAVAGGIIYGSTPNCGHGFGTLFSLSTAGPYRLLYMFNGATDGAAPLGRLAMNASGALFGVTSGGGRFGHGTLFKFADGVLTTLHDFGGAQDAGAPLQGPTLSQAGVLFGASPGGGGKPGWRAVALVARCRLPIILPVHRRAGWAVPR